MEFVTVNSNKEILGGRWPFEVTHRNMSKIKVIRWVNQNEGSIKQEK